MGLLRSCVTCLTLLLWRNWVHSTVSCPTGDTSGIVSNGTTCSQLISSASYKCYNDSIETSCCASCNAIATGISDCPYGNRVEDCIKELCSSYVNRSECCFTCRTTTTITTTTTTAMTTTQSPAGNSTSSSPSQSSSTESTTPSSAGNSTSSLSQSSLTTTSTNTSFASQTSSNQSPSAAVITSSVVGSIAGASLIAGVTYAGIQYFKGKQLRRVDVA